MYDTINTGIVVDFFSSIASVTLHAVYKVGICVGMPAQLISKMSSCNQYMYVAKFVLSVLFLWLFLKRFHWFQPKLHDQAH